MSAYRGEAVEPQRERLNAAMTESRLDLRLRWTEVAKRAGIDSSTLRRIRYGEGAISDLAARGLEDALEWPHGTIAALLGGEPLADPGLDDDRAFKDARQSVQETVAKWAKDYGAGLTIELIDEATATLRAGLIASSRERPHGRDTG
jgi:hypothetical protein